MKQLKPTKPTQEQSFFCKENGITFDQFTGKTPMKGNIYLGFFEKVPKGFCVIIIGSLLLGSVEMVSEAFEPTVEGDLIMNEATELSKGFNPTVGGDLYLESLESLPKLFRPNVGGAIFIKGRTVSSFKTPTKNKQIT